MPKGNQARYQKGLADLADIHLSDQPEIENRNRLVGRKYFDAAIVQPGHHP